MAKTWFITGTSRGFGREWDEAALERGDRVAAAARDTGALTPLVERYGNAVTAGRLGRHRPQGRLRGRPCGGRPLRITRCRSSAVHRVRLGAYDDFRAGNSLSAASKRADPHATREAILAVVDAEDPARRIFLDKGPLDLMRKVHPARIAEWEKWDSISQAAHGS
ncbi:hypothetical protein [Streptomyces sp. TP-A0356]|uniref:hypothetical protein n=1 Tax=Streptomyces sp. TP-A0356 TaxID=1359208 RepID=UPI0006E2173D|nr:hypothetical protein [Streptomyces sp. TP-A0356]